MAKGLKIAATALGAMLAFTAWMIAYLPAELLMRLPEPYTPFPMRQLQGTVWDAHAEALDLPRLSLPSVGWQATFWPLLSGRLEAEGWFGAPETSRHGRAKALVSNNGHSIRLEPFAAQLPLTDLLALLAPQFGLPLEGEIRVNGAWASMEQQRLVGLEGELRAARLLLKGTGMAIPLGELAARAETEGQLIRLTVRDVESPLEVRLDGAIQSSDGLWHLRGVVKGRTPEVEPVVNLLKMAGGGPEDGGARINLNGRLP
ncbi:MAG: type II secretion system protein N [Magnetococcales bacterium]|nr:type II secretion system protein N [Magnetococcales bacterium]